jgi:membrane fusion protein, multidrug efflux system
MRMNRKGLKRHRGSIFAMALISFLLLGGCNNQQGQQSGTAPPAPEAAFVTIAPRPLELTTTLPGRTSAFLVAEIRPQVNGIIQKRAFQEGSDVKAGQLLYQIDPAPFQVALDSAKASLGRAQANLPSTRLRVERFKELLASNAVSRQDYDDAAAALDQVLADIAYWKTAVEAARINLAYTRVIASISGTIGRSSVTDGALVAAYQPMALATIQQMDPIYVDVTQSSAEFLRLRRSLDAGQLSKDEETGGKVRLILEDGSSYAHEGALQFSDVTVNPGTGSFILRIVVPNPDHLLLPGMFVRAVVQEGVASQAILVPQQGVSRNPKGEPVAMIVDDSGVVAQRFLSIDRAIGDQWLVTSGLSAGDRVIVEGMQRIRPGTTVRAVPFDTPPTDQEPGTGQDSQPQQESEGDA